VHAIGEIASELVHIGLIAMAADCDATVFGWLSFNVPTLGALYQDATWRLINERRRALPEQLGKDRQTGPSPVRTFI
jgi:NAD(P) transhydrogenase